MNHMKKVFIVLVIIAAGFAGGMMAQIWGYSKEAFASRDQEIHASRIYIHDPSGQGKAVLWGNSNGGGLMELLGPDGKTRIQLGSYDGSYSQSEKGLPLIGFSDNGGNLRLLFRLAGRNESPVLVFKDRNHRDRMVIGLGLSDGNEEPFFAYFDKSGKKRTLLGTY